MSNRSYSRHSGSSASPPHGQYHLAQPVSSSSQYSSSASAQYPYPAHGEVGPPSSSTYGYYSTSSSPPSTARVSAHSHSGSSMGSVPVPSYYAPASSTSTSERASKRHKAGAVSTQGVYVHGHRTSAPAQADPRYSTSRSQSSHGSREGRESSVSSGYNSPGYSHSHDSYRQQLFQPPSIPGMSPSAMRDAHFYGVRHTHNTPSEYEEEQERFDHGPTELPPRTYSGKSKYDPPRKPGKIPGSAMDFLPILEARFDRLETAIDRYVDYRGQRALSNSILPGMDAPESSSYYSRPSR